jgi:uncharacterized membrane protein
MIPSKILGKVSGESWVGLVDGIYAVVLTLLLLEFPAIIKDLIDSNLSQDSSMDPTVEVGIALISYLSIFLIVFDIWASHKTLLVDVKSAKLFAKSTGLLLFLVSLVPPMYYIVEHSEIRSTLASTKHTLIISLAEGGVFILIALIYSALAAIGSFEKKQDNQNIKRIFDLSYLTSTSASKALIAFLFAGVCTLTGEELFLIAPPIPITIFAALTYFKVNFFRCQIMKRIIQRLRIKR